MNSLHNLEDPEEIAGAIETLKREWDEALMDVDDAVSRADLLQSEVEDMEALYRDVTGEEYDG